MHYIYKIKKETPKPNKNIKCSIMLQNRNDSTGVKILRESLVNLGDTLGIFTLLCLSLLERWDNLFVCFVFTCSIVQKM